MTRDRSGDARPDASPLVLAGDIGGTKTLLGLFACAPGRPRTVTTIGYPTGAFAGFVDLLATFIGDLAAPVPIAAAAFGVAGPVVNNRARLTNVGWEVDAGDLAHLLGPAPARLLNDLEATASGIEALEPDEVVTLQEGAGRADGNAVVLAAGTGLGQAYLHRVHGRLRPLASEGGHADFAPRTDREIQLLQMLRAEYGRAEVEHVLSGPGLRNVYRFTHEGGACPAIAGLDPDTWSAAISEAAMARRCDACEEALAIFVSVYGAEAGNLGLRGVALAGVYVGGGIAPKILPALQGGRFMDAFLDKGKMTDLVARMPVRVILNAETALLGAAVQAQRLVDDP